ncbi:serine hydrolase domain-containing protein [Streptosporangium sp. NPDC006013]|uniref:serine hydrolase domain-containing protein n=1 Tax=Streptosporangium sp. NPDC006013 TaxID=3155596 RepID=UPI0033A407E8
MRTLIAALCAALVLIFGTSPAQASPRMYQCLIDEAVRSPVPGAILQVDGPGRRFTDASGKFQRGGRDLRVSDGFRTASSTKTVTAAVVLKLVEQGKLGLDDLISKYLDPKLIARLPYGSEITVSQLLTHTSGVFDYVKDASWYDYVLAHPQKTWSPTELVTWAIEHGTPYGKPGEVYRYSDSGYVLAALVAQDAAGMPLHRLYRELLLEPLGMKHTYLEYWERPLGPMAHPYLGDLDTHGFNPTFDTFGGGGLVSTAGDLTTFIRGLFEGKVFKDPRTLKTMLTITPQSEKAGTPYGMGIETETVADETIYGHGGFFGSFNYYSPKHRVSVTGTITQSVAVAFGPWKKLVHSTFTHAFGKPVTCPAT